MLVILAALKDVETFGIMERWYYGMSALFDQHGSGSIDTVGFGTCIPSIRVGFTNLILTKYLHLHCNTFALSGFQRWCLHKILHVHSRREVRYGECYSATAQQCNIATVL